MQNSLENVHCDNFTSNIRDDSSEGHIVVLS